MKKSEEQSESSTKKSSISENLSKLIASEEDLQQKHLLIPESPASPTTKIKTRSRLSSAFRSFGKSSSSKKKLNLLPSTDVDSEQVTSGEEQEYDLLNLKKTEAFEKFSEDTKKNKSTLAKKFGIKKLSGGIKKYRVNPKSSSVESTEGDTFTTSSTQTSDTLQRLSGKSVGNIQPTEDADNIDLNNSSVSLINLPSFLTDDSGGNIEDNTVHISGETGNLTATNKNLQLSSGDITAVKFEKVRKIQITIQGKKIEQTTTTSNVSSGGNLSTASPTTITTAAKGERDYFTETLTVSTSPPPLSSSSVTSAISIQNTTNDKIDLQQASPDKTLVVETIPINTVVTAGKRSSRKKNRTSAKSPSLAIINKSKSPVLEAIELDQPSALTESSLDNPPQEKAPTKPSAVSPSAKGAIRKTTTGKSVSTKESDQFQPHFMSLREKSSSLERGRRAPRGPRLTDETDIQNPNDIVVSVAATPPKGDLIVTPKRIEREQIDSENLRKNTDGEDQQQQQQREVYEFSSVSEYMIDSETSADSQMPAFGDLTMDHEVVPIMTSASGEKREHLYKILVIGELGTGKTSFIKRYVHQFFSQNYRATIGVDFALKVLHWDQNTIVRLQLWDIAGQERFGNMTRVYYKEAVGAFIVFDVTRSGTFECVTKWKEDLDSKVQLPDGSPIPCILLANKCDQEKQGIIANTDKMNEYVKENGFAGWYETSAKENVNIEEAARALVNKILLNDKLISAADILDNEKFNLPGSSSEKGKSNCSC